MKTLVDILLEVQKEREVYFKNYMGYSRKIKEIAKKFLGVVKVYLFGSIVEKDIKPDSDIDILIISSNATRVPKSEIRAEVLRQIGYLSPFEIHIITPEEYDSWYKGFIKNKIIEI